MVNQQCGNCKKVINGILWTCNYCKATKHDTVYGVNWRESDTLYYHEYTHKDTLDYCELEYKINKLESRMDSLILNNIPRSGDIWEVTRDPIKEYFTNLWGRIATITYYSNCINVSVQADPGDFEGNQSLPYMQNKGYYLDHISFGCEDIRNRIKRTLYFKKIC